MYVDRTACAGCGACIEACPTGAIALDDDDGVATINPALCNQCLACIDACPTGAIRQVNSHELVPVGAGEIVEGQVIEEQATPVLVSQPPVTARQPSRLVALAGTTLAWVGNWLVPRAADALLGVVERRLTRGTPRSSLANSPRSTKGGSLTRQTDNGGRGRSRQRRRRHRGD